MKREDGYTLIEFLVAGAIFVVVLGAVLALFEQSARQLPDDTESGHSLEDARTGLSGITRELRQANYVTITDTSATLTMPDGSVVTYNCALTDPVYTHYRYCRRTDSLGSATNVVRRVANGATPVFTQEGTGYYRVHVEVPSRGERSELPDRTSNPRGRTVVLEDGAYVRNMDTGV